MSVIGCTSTTVAVPWTIASNSSACRPCPCTWTQTSRGSDRAAIVIRRLHQPNTREPSTRGPLQHVVHQSTVDRGILTARIDGDGADASDHGVLP
jgi:hypothetical protein